MYIKTTDGDYVYYKEYYTAETEYLLPIDAFYEFTRAIYNERLQHGYEDGWGPSIEEIYDLEPYKIDISNTNWIYVTIAIVVATVLAVAIIITVKAKRKKVGTSK